MVAVEPFAGQIARPSRVGEVVAPAYDALTVQQRRQYRVDNPLCYLHVTRSAPDEDDADTVDNATLVRRGRQALERLLAADVFAPADPAAYLIYELETESHRQRGLVGEISAGEFRLQAKPHEGTRPDRAALLAEHFLAVRASSSPVACTVDETTSLAAALLAADSIEPAVVHHGDDGLTQRVWRVDDPHTAASIRASIAGAKLYIVDGHHRAAANGQLLDRGIQVPLLVTIFPPESLDLAGFHRLIGLPADMSQAEFITRVGRRFGLSTTDELVEPEPGSVVIHAQGRWHRVTFDERPANGGAQVRLGSLDPAIVEREIIQAIAARDHPADVHYMPDVGHIDDIVAEAERQGRTLILVPAVKVADMIEVADGGLVMPPKSTYFLPKVRSGLFLRRYEPIAPT